MQYKTIVLELLQQHPGIREPLQSQGKMMQALDLYSGELKTSHEAWKERLSQAKPNSDPSQIASEALEIALKQLEEALSSGTPAEETEPLSLDAAMAFVRNHTPPA